jgi:hypothetical protein
VEKHSLKEQLSRFCWGKAVFSSHPQSPNIFYVLIFH